MTEPGAYIEHPLLAACAPAHGFGTRGCAPPPGLQRPRQVHGADVWIADPAAQTAPEADAVLTGEPGRAVGVLTADCVPVLLAAEGTPWVAAVHAGWRGLARGVILAAVERLCACAGDAAWRAVIGPRIGPCCYEVDAPVIDALRQRFDDALDDAIHVSRPRHHWLDLGALAREALLRAGLAAPDVALLPDACTRCDPLRFDSYRRDGPRAGRLLHFVVSGRA